MAATRAEIRGQLRALLSDFPWDSAALKTGVSAADTLFEFEAADIAKFKDGYDVQVEDEVCRCTNVDTTTNKLTVIRGYMGSTAAAHVAGKIVWAHTLFTDYQLNVLIARAIRSTWPSLWLAREIIHSAKTNQDYEYTLAKPHVISIYLETGVGEGEYRPIRNCYLRSYVATAGDGSEVEKAILTFNVLPPSGLQIRYGYIEGIAVLGSDTAKLEAEAIYPSLVEYLVHRAASYAAAELRARRQRFYEYSVATADRVADIDALIRSEFAYRNAAEVLLSDMKRPFPPTWGTRQPR